jgi:hypothetical protein
MGKISDSHTISYLGRILVIIAADLTTVNIKLSEISTTNQKVLDPIMSGSTARSVSKICYTKVNQPLGPTQLD